MTTKPTKGTGRQHRDPLVGLLLCGHCGQFLRRIRSQSGSVSYGCMNALHHGPTCGAFRSEEKVLLPAIHEKLVAETGAPSTFPDEIHNKCRRVICWWKRRDERRWALDRVELRLHLSPRSNSEEGDR